MNAIQRAVTSSLFRTRRIFDRRSRDDLKRLIAGGSVSGDVFARASDLQRVRAQLHAYIQATVNSRVVPELYGRVEEMAQRRDVALKLYGPDAQRRTLTTKIDHAAKQLEQRMFRELRTGQQRGLTQRQIAERVSDVWQRHSSFKNLAAFETARAFNTTVAVESGERGLRMVVTLSSHHAHADMCDAFEGQVVSKTVPPPPYHAYCQCYLTPITLSGAVVPVASDDENAPSVQTIGLQEVTKVAETLEFPLDRIEVRVGPGPTFKVGTKEFKEAGHFNPTTGKVVIWNNGQDADYILPHEIQHVKNWEVKAQLEIERKRLWDMEIAVPAGAPREAHIIRADGEIWPHAQAMVKRDFPAYHAIGNEWEMHLRDMQQEDGVSNYSTSYWESWEAGTRFHDGIFRPIDETLAEIGRRHYAGDWTPKYAKEKPHLAKLYSGVNKVYAANRKRQKRSIGK